MAFMERTHRRHQSNRVAAAISFQTRPGAQFRHGAKNLHQSLSTSLALKGHDFSRAVWKSILKIGFSRCGNLNRESLPQGLKPSFILRLLRHD
jgi:hypothetical protein